MYTVMHVFRFPPVFRNLALFCPSQEEFEVVFRTLATGFLSGDHL